MKSVFTLLFVFSSVIANSQIIKDLTPQLVGSDWELTAKERDSIKKTAALYKSATEKRSNKQPLTKKESELLSKVEDDAGLDIFLEHGSYYYVGAGYGCCYYENGGPDSIWSTSTLDKYSPDDLVDETLDKAWVEGEKDSGIGQSISFRMIPEAWPMENIIIYNGYQKDIALWRNNNRVKQLLMYIDDKPVARLNLKDVTSGQSFDVNGWLPQRKEPYFIKFEIVKIYKGAKYDDTAISEIIFDGPVSH